MSLNRKVARRRIAPVDQRSRYEAAVSALRSTKLLATGAKENPSRLRARLEDLFKAGMTITQSRAESAAVADASEWKELWLEWRAERAEKRHA